MENKILLQDLAQGVSNRSSIQKKDADIFVRNVFDIIIQYLQEEKIVKIKGLGTFKVIEVSGRDSVNVNTGERIHISGHSKITFTPDAGLRDQVNRPFADFETIIINDGIDIAEMERVPETSDNDDEEDIENDNASPLASAESLVETVVEASSVDNQNDTIEETSNSESQLESPEEELEQEMPEMIPEEVASRETEEENQDMVQEELASGEPEEEPREMMQEEGKSVETEEDTQVEPEDESSIESAHIQEAESNEEMDDETEENYDIKHDNNSNEERVVYIERRPCKYCRICFVLMTLALMALSYVAGHQHWFQKDYAEREKNMNELLQQMTQKKQGNQTSIAPSPAAPPVATKGVTDDGNSKVNETEVQDAPTSSSPAVRADEQKNREQIPAANTSTKPAVTPSSPKSQPVATPTTTKSEPSLNDNSYDIIGIRCNHTVKSGEGLYKIARLYYNDMNMATYIMRYNSITDPNIITEGTILRIPELRKK